MVAWGNNAVVGVSLRCRKSVFSWPRCALVVRALCALKLLQATWGLLGELYRRHGRIRSLRMLHSRPQQQLQKIIAQPEQQDELQQNQPSQQQQRQQHRRMQHEQHEQPRQQRKQQRTSQRFRATTQPASPDPARPSPTYQCHRISLASHGDRHAPEGVSPPTTPRQPTAIATSRATGVAALQASAPALRLKSRHRGRSPASGAYESNPSSTGNRVVDHSRRVAETACMSQREKGRRVKPLPTPRAASTADSFRKGTDYGNDGGPANNFDEGVEGRRAKKGGNAAAGIEHSAPSEQNNRRQLSGKGEDDEVDSNLHPPTGVPHSVSTPLFGSNDVNAAAPSPKKTPKRVGESGTRGLVSKVTRSSLESARQSHGVEQIPDSENAIRLSRTRNLRDAGALISLSQAGERASAETARWLRWNPASRESSLVGMTGQDRGEKPIPPDKAIGEIRGNEESVCHTCSSSLEGATASVNAAVPAVIPPSSVSNTDHCVVVQPLSAAALPRPRQIDIGVEADTPIGRNIVHPRSDAAAFDLRNTRNQGPQLSPMEESPFVDSPLSKTEAGWPGAACEEHVEQPGAIAEPLLDRLTSGNLHQLPSADDGPRHPLEMRVTQSINGGRVGGDGVNQLSLADLTTFDDIKTPSVCMLLALSSDPFARGVTSDLLPVAHMSRK